MSKKKEIIYCRYCGKPIPVKYRRRGRDICSKKCLQETRLINCTKYNRKIRDAFQKFKEKRGCTICGYNKFGGSLDFHHIDKESKQTRICSSMWYTKNKRMLKEIKKCILLCKNCHHELHFNNRQNSKRGHYKDALSNSKN